VVVTLPQVSVMAMVVVTAMAAAPPVQAQAAAQRPAAMVPVAAHRKIVASVRKAAKRAGTKKALGQTRAFCVVGN
jgi:hypothetical protein